VTLGLGQKAGWWSQVGIMLGQIDMGLSLIGIMFSQKYDMLSGIYFESSQCILMMRSRNKTFGQYMLLLSGMGLMYRNTTSHINDLSKTVKTTLQVFRLYNLMPNIMST
jgi:hypothetical protein